VQGVVVHGRFGRLGWIGAAVCAFGLLGQDALAADLYGAPKGAKRELASQRTESSATWELASGEQVTRVGGAPMHWRSGSGAWRRFDLGISPIAGGRLRADAGTTRLEFPARLDGAEASAMRVSAQAGALSMWLEGARASATRDSRGLNYVKALPGVDVIAEAVPEGLKETLRLAGPASRRSFAYRLRLGSGLTPRIDPSTGDVLIESWGAVRKTRLVIPAATVHDSADSPAAGPIPAYALESAGDGTWRLSFRLDDAWLNDPSRTWPVLVDPTTSTTSSAQIVHHCAVGPQAFWSSGHCDRTDEPELPVSVSKFGSFNVLQLLRFESLGTVLGAQKIIDSAKLHLYVTSSDQVRNPKLMVTTPTQDWTTSVTWSTKPADARPQGLLTVDPVIPTPVSGPVTFDVTPTVTRWQEHSTNTSAGLAEFGLQLQQLATWPKCGFGGITPMEVQCGTNVAQIASATNADLTHRPYLEIRHWPPAPAESVIVTPHEGLVTGRRIVLEAYATNLSVSTVRFQYVAGSQREWADVPAGALRRVQDGSVLTSSEISVTAHHSDAVVWDLQSTTGGDVDGSVHIRAVLDAPSGIGGGITPEVNVQLDRRNAPRQASVPIGPGEVDMLSGDFSASATDVSVDAWGGALALSRTYHSRGTSNREAELFGPHWTASFAGSGGAMPYRSLYNYSEVDEQVVERWIEAPITYEFEAVVDFGDGMPFTMPQTYETTAWQPVTEVQRWEHQYAVIEKADGEKITFTRDVAEDGQEGAWQPDEQHRDLTVSRTGTAWTVTDGAGNVTTFGPDGADSPSYHPTSFYQPGSTQSPSFLWAADSHGRMRLEKVTSPRAAPSLGQTQDRWLRFHWTTLADDQPRVDAIYFGRWNGTQVDEIPVATYTYDTAGRLETGSNPRVSGGLPTTYAYNTDGRLSSITPPGEAPWRLEYASSAGDANVGRLKAITRAHPTLGDATWSVRYDVPLTGSAAPRDMSPATLATWGEIDDLPTDATAVFPPDQVPAAVPTSWTKATVHYVDRNGQEVNSLLPGGALSTTQYDTNGNVQTELTAGNRARALASSGDTAAKAQSLMTIHFFATNGVDEIEVRGPTHEIRLNDGTTLQGREVKETSYDQNRPDTKDYHLPTTNISYVRLASGATYDREVVETSYGDDVAFPRRGWDLRRPTKVVVDPGSSPHLGLTTQYAYDPQLPLLRSKRTPASTGGGSHETTYSYFGVDGTSGCPGGDGATGLVCREVSPLYTTTYQYNPDWRQTLRTEASTAIRTTTTTYDAAGRESTVAVTGPGQAIPTITTEYSPTTGRDVKTTSAAIGGDPQRTVERTYDSNGRLWKYKDAEAELTTYAYDIVGRLSQVGDTRGTTSYGYDDRGLTTSLLDSSIGTAMTGSYDADGRLTEETLPNGVKVQTGYSESGTPVDRTITKPGCGTCTWPTSHVTLDAQGRWVREATDSRTRKFEYDLASRLTAVEDTPSGGSCTTRKYTYDADSNRTARATYPASTGGACSRTTAPATQTLAYDGADRITSSGFVHDALGRMTAAPASSIGNALSTSYFSNDQPRTLSQNGLTRTYELDPLMRSRARQTNTSPATNEIDHFADDGDAPSWTASGSSWTRYVKDLNGDVIAARKSSGATTYLLHDLHGDVIAEASASTSATGPVATFDYDEFGVPLTKTPEPVQLVSYTGPVVPWSAESQVVIDRPGGTQTGDLLIAELFADEGANMTAPMGWQLVPGSVAAVGTSKTAVYSHVQTATDPASFVFDFSIDGWHIGGMKAFRNTDPAHPPTAVAAAGNQIPSVTPTAPSSWTTSFAVADFDDPEWPDYLSFWSPASPDWSEIAYTNLGGRSITSASNGPLAAAGTPTDTYDIWAGWQEPTVAGGVTTLLTALSIPPTPTTKYGYLGANARSTELPSGTVEMGVRTYNPQLGRFLQVDPVSSGSANDYDYVNQNPLNAFDLDGRIPCGPCQAMGHAIKSLVGSVQRAVYYTTEVVCYGSAGVQTVQAVRITYKILGGLRYVTNRTYLGAAATASICGVYQASKGIQRYGA
jgi:RHS repeat-associated protein